VNHELVLSEELRRLVESRLKSTLRGIEETLQEVLERQEIGLEELKETIKTLEMSFNILSQRWSLQILYTLFLRNIMGFGELKKVLDVNSRTLSDKLKSLKHYGYIGRFVEQGPPLRVEYSLTELGKNTILLALPLLYYSTDSSTEKA